MHCLTQSTRSPGPLQPDRATRGPFSGALYCNVMAARGRTYDSRAHITEGGSESNRPLPLQPHMRSLADYFPHRLSTQPAVDTRPPSRCGSPIYTPKTYMMDGGCVKLIGDSLHRPILPRQVAARPASCTHGCIISFRLMCCCISNLQLRTPFLFQTSVMFQPAAHVCSSRESVFNTKAVMASGVTEYSEP